MPLRAACCRVALTNTTHAQTCTHEHTHTHRSRVVSVNNPERSYHIFYQLCDGASAEERKRWMLKPAQEFNYLNQSTCFDIPGDSNAEEYKVCACVHLCNAAGCMCHVGSPHAAS